MPMKGFGSQPVDVKKRTKTCWCSMKLVKIIQKKLELVERLRMDEQVK